METAPDHFAVGYTAITGDAFQGRHEESVLIVFDEATGIPSEYWDAAEGMMTSVNAMWLVICNPTDTSSRMYKELLRGRWHEITISALDHPNIAAELRGDPAPFPAAVRLQWVRERIAEWCTKLDPGDAQAGDFEFEGRYYRPGPLAESRMLGRWPTAGSTSVWPEVAWNACMVPQDLDPKAPLQIGCDVARYGDDFTSMLARRGACALHHETHNGWSTAQTAGRLKTLARKLVTGSETPEEVEIAIDDDGVGGGVTDQGGSFTFLGCSSSHRAIVPNDYPNRRSESWFSNLEAARDRRIDVTRLSFESQLLLRRQLMAPTWTQDSQGRRVVEPKDATKKRLGRSPDDADAFNLAYAPPSGRIEIVKSPW